MISPHPTLQPSWTPEQRQTWSQLARMRGPGEGRALLLSLVLTPGSARERQAWSEECRDVPGAERTRDQVTSLPAHVRLPVIEAVLERMVPLDLAVRQAMLAAVRRVMCADGRVRPIDRLTLLLIRHRLSARPARQRAHAHEPTELTDLALPLRQAVAAVTAYLARLVPVADANAQVGVAGARWHRAVLAMAWGHGSAPPTCQVPDADALAKALAELQNLGWMRRPVLARTWFEATEQVALPPGAAGVKLDLGGAEALRIACDLLDTPLPPELAARFGTLPEPA
ncbi:MAG: hypothetical protein AB9M60_01420 [Leptothrix sp. (in: b-proteobacteria)]